jgi:regulatory protein
LLSLWNRSDAHIGRFRAAPNIQTFKKRPNCGSKVAMAPHARSTPPPLDDASLERLALSYVERFQTSGRRVERYLGDKLRQRGWAGEKPADPQAIVARLARQGYVDDALYAAARARSHQRRGLGPARLRAQLSADGIDDQHIADAQENIDPAQAALYFAQRRRLGPFGGAADAAARRRHFAAMVRAGHAPSLARAILDAADPAAAQAIAAGADAAS